MQTSFSQLLIQFFIRLSHNYGIIINIIPLSHSTMCKFPMHMGHAILL